MAENWINILSKCWCSDSDILL